LKISVGLDEKLKANNRIVFTNQATVLDDELMLFSNVEMGEYRSDSNGKLYAKTGNEIALDDFSHEQNLIIKDEDRVMLISGCSHAGIENILKRAERLVDGQVDAVVGGFHLYNPPTRKYENNERIEKVANALCEFSCHYYTCHCTGIKAFNKMKTQLDARLDYLSVGSEIEL
jgi:7,8-dihydropterin-6-yl-methyl-4-(beta-D-ribofuranosyl)aminobenzene 5'-phosphate synthase